MAGKEEASDLLFDAGRDGLPPFAITGVSLDEDGDVCLECDARASRTLSASEIAAAVGEYEPSKTVYFLSIDASGEAELYNIKDGGTRDRHSSELRLVDASSLLSRLGEVSDPEKLLHLESGTINFTVNSVYLDDQGCLCLESNEIEELSDYTIGLLCEELRSCDPSTSVYFYDDDSQEYYGIYVDEWRIGSEGDLWIKAR